MTSTSDDPFGFSAAAHAQPRQGGEAEPPVALDISGFKPATGPVSDRDAARGAKEVGRQRGYSTRSSKPAKPAVATGSKGRVRIGEAIGKPTEAHADEPRTQLNINTPVSIAVRFKKLEAAEGLKAWQVLERLLDAYPKT